MRSILLLLLLILIVAFVVSLSKDDPSTLSPKPDTYAPMEPVNPQTQTSVVHEQPASTASPCSGIAKSTGRVYDVVSVNTCQAEIPLSGVKLFVQGKIARFGYADMQSRPFAVIEGQQQSSKTLLCAMRPDEGSEVMSLYHVGEVVQVSGDYMGVGPIANNLSMPLLSNCTVASSTDKVASVPIDAKNDNVIITEPQPPRTSMTVGDFFGHGEFSTYTVVNVQGRVKDGRCGLVDEGRRVCWLLLEDVPNGEAGHWHGGQLMMWVKTYDWSEVHSLYKVGDVAQMTCTAFGRGAYDCNVATHREQ